MRVGSTLPQANTDSRALTQQKFIIGGFATVYPPVERPVHLTLRPLRSVAHPCNYQIVASGGKSGMRIQYVQYIWNEYLETEIENANQLTAFFASIQLA